MIKVFGHINSKRVFDALCDHLFNGSYEECNRWWYNHPISGLDNMLMCEVCSVEGGPQRALDWANGYLCGLNGRLTIAEEV